MSAAGQPQGVFLHRFRSCVLLGPSSRDVSSMLLNVRGRLLSWANKYVGIQSCMTLPHHTAVSPDRFACGMSGFLIRQVSVHKYEHNERLPSSGKMVVTHFINGTRNISCSWLLPSGSTPFFVFDLISCKAYPGFFSFQKDKIHPGSTEANKGTSQTIPFLKQS